MGQNGRRRITWAAAAFALGVAVIWGLWPQPVPADLVTLARGPLVVTVDHEGVTDIKDVFTVSAPVPGRVLRSPFKVGDKVEKGKTVVASILPSAPPFLNERNRRIAEAAVKSAEAALNLSGANVTRAEAELEFAKSDLRRARQLAPRGTISQRRLEEARIAYETKGAGLASAKADAIMRQRELERARANLTQPGGGDGADGARSRVDVTAPVSGYVLKVTTESENVVAAGTPLVDIGDPRNLEVNADFLSTDAVRIREGAEATIENWGGEPLHAKVRRVEPAGFTKVSALGVEEQRVIVRLDLTDPPPKWQRLGHDYRVFVGVVVAKVENALTVPLSALFRKGDRWAVFKVADGRAELALVETGERNLRSAEVKSGLTEGDTVIVHPNDRIADGVSITARQISE